MFQQINNEQKSHSRCLYKGYAWGGLVFEYTTPKNSRHVRQLHIIPIFISTRLTVAAPTHPQTSIIHRQHKQNCFVSQGTKNCRIFSQPFKNFRKQSYPLFLWVLICRISFPSTKTTVFQIINHKTLNSDNILIHFFSFPSADSLLSVLLIPFSNRIMSPSISHWKTNGYVETLKLRF